MDRELLERARVSVKDMLFRIAFNLELAASVASGLGDESLEAETEALRDATLRLRDRFAGLPVE